MQRPETSTEIGGRTSWKKELSKGGVRGDSSQREKTTKLGRERWKANGTKGTDSPFFRVRRRGRYQLDCQPGQGKTGNKEG